MTPPTPIAPMIQWQSIAIGYPYSQAARFGAGWLILTVAQTPRGAEPDSTPMALVYVPDAVSGFSDGCQQTDCRYFTEYIRRPSRDGVHLDHAGYHATEEQSRQHAAGCHRAAVCPTCTDFDEALRS